MAEHELSYRDKLDVLRRHIPSDSLDLNYLDPPFNSDQNYNICSRRGPRRVTSAFRAFRGWFVGAGAKTDPQDGRPGTQPGNAAACFTQVAICASSSSSPSWMSM
jgi:hypothetical protein